ncbi:hypothetical protein CRUP_036572 [Coryphaenoides rupestris]|nr:hypothetical protein CRUP_036572 [Coryphaenoides rupestris]
MSHTRALRQRAAPGVLQRCSVLEAWTTARTLEELLVHSDSGANRTKLLGRNSFTPQRQDKTRVYFSDRLYSEDELPAEFKLDLPETTATLQSLQQRPACSLSSRDHCAVSPAETTTTLQSLQQRPAPPCSLSSRDHRAVSPAETTVQCLQQRPPPPCSLSSRDERQPAVSPAETTATPQPLQQRPPPPPCSSWDGDGPQPRYAVTLAHWNG